MTDTRFNEETGEVEIVDVTETRVTGFAVHALITATLGLLPPWICTDTSRSGSVLVFAETHDWQLAPQR
jgi:hypothetical protein